MNTEPINISKILARVSMLTDYSFNNINLKQVENENRIKYNRNNGSLDIEYSTADGLAHELAHACYTPIQLYDYKRQEGTKQSPLNAIEDYRIEQCIQKGDKYLHGLIEQGQEQDYTEFNAKADESIKEQMYIALMDKYKDRIQIKDEQVKQTIDKAMDIIRTNPLDWYTTVQAYETVQSIFDSDKQDKDKEQGQGNNEQGDKKQEQTQGQGDKEQEQTNEQRKAEQRQTKEQDDHIIENLKYAKRNGYNMSPKIEEYKDIVGQVAHMNLEQALKEIQRSLSDKKFNTNKGKLNTRRLGILPNTTMFQRTEKRKNKQDLTIIYDISGSMNRDNKALIVIEFLKAVEQAKTQQLNLNYIAFGYKAVKRLITNIDDYIKAMQDWGNHTDIQSGLELAIKDINKANRNTTILLTDGDSMFIDPSTVKQLQELSTVICITLCHNGNQLKSAGFETVLETSKTEELPQMLRNALIKGK